MNPSAQIYECEVMHQRLKPLQKSFTYRVFMLDVDIDELPKIAYRIHGLAHNRWSLFSINDVDHIHLDKGNIRDNLTEWLAQQGRQLPASAKIRLITFPRVLGYGFNPVSFYYVNSSDGSPLFACLATGGEDGGIIQIPWEVFAPAVNENEIELA